MTRASARPARAAALTLLLTTAPLVAVVLFGCAGESGTPSTTADSEEVLTVEQALTAGKGRQIRVGGYFVSTQAGSVLASALAESYPPQPAGAILPVAGVDASRLVGLSTTGGQAGLAQAMWTDYPVVFEGVVEAGVLEVREIPPVEEVSFEGGRLRFSPGRGAVRAGSMVWWALDVTNTGPEDVDLTFRNGQRGEVILQRGGVEAYRWSAGKSFIQSMETVSLEPGVPFPVVLSGELRVTPGIYALTARVTGRLGPPETAVSLPPVEATLLVIQDTSVPTAH